MTARRAPLLALGTWIAAVAAIPSARTGSAEQLYATLQFGVALTTTALLPWGVLAWV